MRAFACASSVRMPLCEPVNEIAGAPRSCSAIASSAMETRSPVVSNMSISRRLGVGETCRASAISSSVVCPIAETTTTMSFPAARASAIRRATARMRSGPLTDVPPYLCTRVGMGGICTRDASDMHARDGGRAALRGRSGFTDPGPGRT